MIRRYLLRVWRPLLGVLMLAALVGAPAVLAELVPADLTTQLVDGPLMEAPETEITTLSTSPAEVLASGDQSRGGYIRASILNQGTVDVCVSWSGGTATTCAAGGSDCDGDDDDGVTVGAGERYSPVYSATKLGRLCAAAASGTPNVKVEYDTP